MPETIHDQCEFASDQEMAEANDPRTGTGTPDTAPHEPVRLTLWERLTRRLPEIKE